MAGLALLAILLQRDLTSSGGALSSLAPAPGLRADRGGASTQPSYDGQFPPLATEAQRFDALLLLRGGAAASRGPGLAPVSSRAPASTVAGDRPPVLDLVGASAEEPLEPFTMGGLFELKARAGGAPERRELRFRWQGLRADRSQGTLLLERIDRSGRSQAVATIPPEALSSFDLAIEPRSFPFWEPLTYRLRWSEKPGSFEYSTRASVVVEPIQPPAPTGLALAADPRSGDPQLSWELPFVQAGDELHLEARIGAGSWSSWKALPGGARETGIEAALWPKDGYAARFRIRVSNGPLWSDPSEEVGLDERALAALRGGPAPGASGAPDEEPQPAAEVPAQLADLLQVESLGVDAGTQGAWTGIYGSLGTFSPHSSAPPPGLGFAAPGPAFASKAPPSGAASLPALAAAAPDKVKLVPTASTPVREGTQERAALAWQSADAIEFDVKVPTPESRQVSIALLPPSIVQDAPASVTGASSVAVTAIDKLDGTERVRQVVPLSGATRWVRLEASGSFRIRAQALTPGKPVVVGMLALDPAPPKAEKAGKPVAPPEASAWLVAIDPVNGKKLVGPYGDYFSVTFTDKTQMNLKWKTVTAWDLQPKGAIKSPKLARWQRMTEDLPPGFDLALGADIQFGYHVSFQSHACGYTQYRSPYYQARKGVWTQIFCLAQPYPGMETKLRFVFPDGDKVKQLTLQLGIPTQEQLGLNRKLPDGPRAMRLTVYNARTNRKLFTTDVQGLEKGGLRNVTLGLLPRGDALILQFEDLSLYGPNRSKIPTANQLSPGLVGIAIN